MQENTTSDEHAQPVHKKSDVIEIGEKDWQGYEQHIEEFILAGVVGDASTLQLEPTHPVRDCVVLTDQFLQKLWQSL